MCRKAQVPTSVVFDKSKPSGVLSQKLFQDDLQELMKILNEINKKYRFDTILSDEFSSSKRDITNLHFGRPLKETNCFRGYPTLSCINQFHYTDCSYILHMDSDMLFHEATDFSWVRQGMKIMEENDDILCVLPQGGPPTSDGSLNQGNTEYRVDEKRGLYLFKNFTSRHYLIHRERFLGMLPLQPLWLSWREPIKSRLFGNGKMLCWESMVEDALKNSNMWRADLMSAQAWSLHPGDRSEEFYQLLPKIIGSVNRNEFPEEQRGHFDLHMNDWIKFLN